VYSIREKRWIVGLVGHVEDKIMSAVHLVKIRCNLLYSVTVSLLK